MRDGTYVQMDFYARTATHPGIRTVCEVGFNAGYSTAVWLTANPTLKVISFDLITANMGTTYGKPCAEALQNKFPGRLEVQVLPPNMQHEVKTHNMFGRSTVCSTRLYMKGENYATSACETA